jgi:hypothetical protein
MISSHRFSWTFFSPKVVNLIKKKSVSKNIMPPLNELGNVFVSVQTEYRTG